MRDRPDAARLLALARALEEAAPLLPEERRVDPALVARAAAIAERESRAGDASIEDCHRALVALFGPGDFASLFARLAQEIRAGRYDGEGPERERLRRLLWAITLRKLEESNPDYLAAAGRGQPFQNGFA